MNLTTVMDDLSALWRIRIFEEEVARLRVAGDIAGSVHLCIGQEAIPVGVCSVLGLATDTVFATYRGHGWALACGTDPTALMAELLGRSTGTNGGRGGSAYLSDPDHGFYGENSIVGAGAPIAVGAALAARFDGSGRVAVTVFGDGAMNQGSVHEAMNFAAAAHLPVVFIVEDNGYSELTPTVDMVGDPDLSRRGQVYGFAGSRVDGNDVETVRRQVHAAVDQCRRGEGPALVVAATARLVGHYIGDAQAYRPPGEVDRARLVEPIIRQRDRARALGATEEQLRDAENAARAHIADAVAAALAAPRADGATVKEHMHA